MIHIVRIPLTSWVLTCRLKTRALVSSSPFKESELVSTQHYKRCKHNHIPVKQRINQSIPAIISYLLSIHLSSYSSVQMRKQKQQFRQVIQDTERFMRFFSPITLLMIDLPAPTMQRNMMLATCEKNKNKPSE